MIFLGAVLVRALLLAVLGAGVWLFWGGWAALGSICALLAAAQLFHLWQLHRLHHWLQATEASRLPEDQGLWGDIFVDLYRAQKAQKRDRDRLSASLDRFREAARALPEGVVMLDGDGRIEWFNGAAQAHFGLDPARDAGTLVTHLIRQPEFADYVKAGGGREDLTLHVGAGEGWDLSVLLVPFEGGRLIYSRDITQLRKSETMRRDFIANVSHELRTPLTVILGFLEPLAEDEALDVETRRRFLRMIHEQAQRMSRLVEDLLTLSRLEAQSAPQQEAPVDVPALLALLVEEGRALSSGRHEFVVEIQAGALFGCEGELRSAFGNLIANAVRYTPAGGRVEIAWRNGEHGPVFSVRDSGIGIAAEHLPRLTERFYRVDKGRSTETGGTGLGLAIVKYVLRRHQATLQIESQPGQGSCFRAEFPAARLCLPLRQH